MKIMRIVCLLGLCALYPSSHFSLLHAQESQAQVGEEGAIKIQRSAPSKWEVAGKEVKEASTAVADATRDSASSAWKGIKQGSKKAWKKTKSGSKELYDAVGDTSKEAWDATKEESKELWHKGKSAWNDATGSSETKKPAAGDVQTPKKPEPPAAPEPPVREEPETYKL